MKIIREKKNNNFGVEHLKKEKTWKERKEK